jgi:hypothetical protein
VPVECHPHGISIYDVATNINPANGGFIWIAPLFLLAWAFFALIVAFYSFLEVKTHVHYHLFRDWMVNSMHGNNY